MTQIDRQFADLNSKEEDDIVACKHDGRICFGIALIMGSPYPGLRGQPCATARGFLAPAASTSWVTGEASRCCDKRTGVGSLSFGAVERPRILPGHIPVEHVSNVSIEPRAHPEIDLCKLAIPGNGVWFGCFVAVSAGSYFRLENQDQMFGPSSDMQSMVISDYIWSARHANARTLLRLFSPIACIVYMQEAGEAYNSSKLHDPHVYLPSYMGGVARVQQVWPTGEVQTVVWPISIVSMHRFRLHLTASKSSFTFISKLWASPSMVDEPVADLCHADASGLNPCQARAMQ
nr:hypothetical protein CFP56_36380 [Quercus suber]